MKSNLALSDPGRTLKHLRVCGCYQLKYVLPLNANKNLQQLENIEISQCEMLEQVFGDENETGMTKSNSTIELPKVKSLVLEELHKFSRFCQDGSMVDWLSLERVKVVMCPLIKKFSLGAIQETLLTSMEVINEDNEDLESGNKHLFYLKELSTTKEREIEDSEELENYVKIMELWPSSFSKLRILKAKHCNQLLNNFLFILFRRSNDLEELTVANCELIEQVFDLKGLPPVEQGPLIFPKLGTIRLRGLPKLNCIWNKDPRRIVELGKLVNLEISECGLQRSPLSTALMEELVLLESLKIESCEMIERVLEDDTDIIQKRSFLNLKYLQLVSLPNLIKFNSGHCNFKFPALLEMTIDNCPKFDAFTTGFLANRPLTSETTYDHVPLNAMIMGVCPKLQKLKLVGGHETFKEIRQGRVSNINITDCKLKEVELDSFSYLRYIFPSTLLQIMSKQLETLVVTNCSSLTNVFEFMDNDSINAFESLMILRIKGCGSLQHLLLPYRCPSLRVLDISDCPSLEDIFIDPEIKADDDSFPNLESLVLQKLPKLSRFVMIFYFQKLQKATIVNCPAIKPSSKNVSDKDNNFMDEELDQVLYDFKEDDELSWSGIRTTKTLLPQLQELKLSDLPKMQIWKHGPPYRVFKNLISLKIIRCGSIKTLFSISEAEYLSSLNLLTLYGCENMVQVLVGGGSDGILVFQKLETLVLKLLPMLTSFCDENVKFGE